MNIAVNVELNYHEKQLQIFDDAAKYKVIAKGRRFGLTRGFAKYVIERMIEKKIMVLWVDTTYSNIKRYYERYFLPELKQIPKKFWKYNLSDSQLKLIDSVCDLKSADRPENMEGFGYDLIILNEAGIILRNEKLWNETIRPMALDFDADLIIGGTPKGKRNKRGEKHLFCELFEKGNGKSANSTADRRETEDGRDNKWKSFCFSSYDNPLIKKEVIDEFVSEVSPQLRDQEIFGKFVDYSNESIIKRDWWRHSRQKDGGQDSDVLNNNKKSFGIFQSWDTAFKINEENDYSVCTTWKIFENGFYLIDLFRERFEFPELKRKVVELHEKFLPREILIEDHASGQSLIQELRRETRLPIKPIKKDKDKISYVHAITPLIEAGKVILSGNVKSETADVMINECEEFPNSEHDDIVDSISQFLNYAKNFKSSFEEIVTKKVQRKKFY